jgi:hypothetical protein
MSHLHWKKLQYTQASFASEIMIKNPIMIREEAPLTKLSH